VCHRTRPYFHYYALPHRLRVLSADDSRLSVRLSVPCLPRSRERKGINSKLKIGRKEAHDTVTRDPI